MGIVCLDECREEPVEGKTLFPENQTKIYMKWCERNNGREGSEWGGGVHNEQHRDMWSMIHSHFSRFDIV